MSIEKQVKILCFVKNWKLLKNGEAPVFIRISYENERTEFGIKESIDPKLWDERLERAKGKSGKSELINSLL